MYHRRQPGHLPRRPADGLPGHRCRRRTLNSYQGGMCISARPSLPPACIESGPIEAGRCGLPAEQMQFSPWLWFSSAVRQEVLEEPHPVEEFHEPPVFLRGQPGGDEVPYLPRIVQQGNHAGQRPDAVRLCTPSCFCTPVLARYAGSELSDPDRMPGQRPYSHELSGRIHGYSRPRHRPSPVDATLALRHSIWCRFINRSKDSMSFSHCKGYAPSSDRNRGALTILAPRCSPMGSRCRRSPVIR